MVGRGDAWRRRHNATTGCVALRTDYTVFDLVNTGSALAVLFVIFLVCVDVGYLRFLRDLNRNYLLPLAQVIPQQRTLVHPTAMPVIPDHQRGQQPGNALLTCGTCHYRLPQPLNGANMVKDYPGLVGTDPKAKECTWCKTRELILGNATNATIGANVE